MAKILGNTNNLVGISEKKNPHKSLPVMSKVDLVISSRAADSEKNDFPYFL